MGAALIPAALGGSLSTATAFTAIQGVGAVAGGLGSLSAGNAEASQQLQRAEIAGIQGLEQEASLRDQLSSTLSTVAAIRGANGVSQTSPTALAIAGSVRKYARQDIVSNRTNVAANVAGLNSSANSAQLRGRLGLLGGFANAAPSFLSIAQG